MVARRRSLDSVARRSKDAGTPISRATVHNLITGGSMPRRETLLGFLRESIRREGFPSLLEFSDFSSSALGEQGRGEPVQPGTVKHVCARARRRRR